MAHDKIAAVFMRCGTSKALICCAPELPADRTDWGTIFLTAMGSPDLNGRQLNGRGGGVTLVAKICVIGSPSRDDANIDDTFAQMLLQEARLSYQGNCGHTSAAMGPFAVDEGLVNSAGELAAVRMHNITTK
jgi:2-methylaconitate cis-trans-isomerase PrpF